MVGMFVSLCLASKKSSEREFFVPAGTHLGVKLLSYPKIADEVIESNLLGEEERCPSNLRVNEKRNR